MANTIGELNVEIGARLDKLERGLSEVEQGVKGTGEKVQSIAAKSFGKVATTIAAAFSVRAIVQFGQEAADLAARAEGVRTAFERLNKPDLLANLRRATRGTVTDVELMRQAVRAENFQVPLDRLATFFEFASGRAAQTGESVDYLVNSIIDGIGRKSTLVMDNLGISAARLQSEIKKVGDFGEAAGIIIQEELGKAGEVALTASQEIAAQRAELENIKTEIGENLIPVQIAYNKLLLEGSRILADFNLEFFENFTIAPLKLSEENFNALAKAMGRVLTAQEKGKILGNGFTKEQREMIKAVKDGTFDFEAFKKAQEDLNKEQEEVVDTGEKLEDYLKRLNKQLKEKRSLEEFKNEMEDIAAAMESMIIGDTGAGSFAKDMEAGFREIDLSDLADIGMEGEEGVMDQITKAVEKTTEALALASSVGNTFGGVLQSSFDAALISGENFAEVFGNAIKNLILQLISAAATATVLAAVLAPISGVGFGKMFGRLFLGPTGGGGTGGMAGSFGQFFVSGSNLVTSTNRARKQEGRSVR
tara:strand:+ start:93 stop:1694 length:1602 start_codon:yes stop_codon:yes gene_type:complete